MPPYFGSSHLPKDTVQDAPDTPPEDGSTFLEATPAELAKLGDLHRQTTRTSHAGLEDKLDVHTEFKDFLRENNPEGRWYPAHQGVCYDSLSVFGSSGSGHSAKTFGTALWRTLTCQDILEKIVPSSFKLQNVSPKAIISGFSGVVHSGEMMLYVLSLRFIEGTIANVSQCSW